jgi:hypothetical protein
LWEIFLVRFSSNMYLYILLGNRLLQDILVIALHDWLPILSYQESLSKHCAWFLYFTICFCFFVVKMTMLEIIAIYHREIIPNTYCPVTIGILLCGRKCWSSLHWRLIIIALFLAKKLFCFNSRCLPCLLWILLIFLNMFSVSTDIGRVVIPFCALLYSNAKFYIMHNSWGSYPIFFRTLSLCFYHNIFWSLSSMCWWKANFFWYFVPLWKSLEG